MSAFLRPANADLRFVARVTVELVTPMLVATGERGRDADAIFSTDANGLPVLPGSSIAGVLAHAWGEKRDVIFGAGSVHEAPQDEQTQASALIVSDGVVHLSDDRPAPMLPGAVWPEGESVAWFLREGVRRDHVRIDARGAADGDGKYDLRACPAGARFTFELELLADKDQGHDARTAWDRLLGLLHTPIIRFGGRTRRGLGAMHICQVHAGVFDLSETQGLNDYKALPRDLRAAHGLASVSDAPAAETAAESIRLVGFKAETPWLFGGGVSDNADIAPKTEQRIVKGGNGLRVSEDLLLIPGSSLKGAIAHRTRFHLNRLCGNWLREDGTAEENDDVKHAHEWLFGRVAKKGQDDRRNTGALIVNDIYVERAKDETDLYWHVCIDRFTGGVRAGMLFQEEVTSQREAGGDLALWLVTHDDADDAIRDLARAALRDALEDLQAGRLTLGAASGRGHGGFVCDRVDGLEDAR